LRLIEDILVAGGQCALPDTGTNRVVYVVHGGISAGEEQFADDRSWHGKGTVRLVAGERGATVWRYELAPLGSQPTLVPGGSGRSHVKLARPIALPAPQVLIRNDSVSFPPGGCAFLHTHQGPGIRCLIEGGIRIDTEGASTSYGPGGAWFEGGPAPVFAQAAPDRPTRFIRVMVLPAALLGKSSIHYVNPEDREKPKSQSYKGYVDALIEP
jgi:hypothetical protein